MIYELVSGAMTQIEAIYRHGVFQPLAPVALEENQRVRLSVEIPPPESAQRWLKDVRELHRRTIARHGVLPDSTIDIAADRLR